MVRTVLVNALSLTDLLGKLLPAGSVLCVNTSRLQLLGAIPNSPRLCIKEGAAFSSFVGVISTWVSSHGAGESAQHHGGEEGVDCKHLDEFTVEVRTEEMNVLFIKKDNMMLLAGFPHFYTRPTASPNLIPLLNRALR